MGELAVQTHDAELDGPAIFRGVWPGVWACGSIRKVGAKVNLMLGVNATTVIRITVNGSRLAPNIGLGD